MALSGRIFKSQDALGGMNKIKGFGDGEENQRVEGRKKQILDDKSSTTR